MSEADYNGDGIDYHYFENEPESVPEPVQPTLDEFVAFVRNVLKEEELYLLDLPYYMDAYWKYQQAIEKKVAGA